MNLAPFLIFPWQRPFLPDLKDFLDAQSCGRPGAALVIVPHNRPWRYLVRLYAAAGHKGLLPKVMPLSDTVAAWRAHTSATPLHTANMLDRVALLRQCVNDLARDDANLSARFADMDMALFLPWGLRLAALLEEMLGQDVDAIDLAHAEQEVAAPAAALLGALGRIGKTYKNLLEQRGWTTPGLDAHAVAHDTGQIPPLFRPAEDRPVFIAGFSLLNGSEDTVLRRLWRAGAQVCLHADPALGLGTGEHWACQEQAAWLRRWKAQARAAVIPPPTDAARKPAISFFSGYDCHSQLQALRAALSTPTHSGTAETPAEGPATAVVLTDSSLLMPVLHHLPDKDVNVSMGYSLERSPLNRLLEALLQLQTSRSEDGRYYWRSLLQCLRHPYLGMLRAEDQQDEGVFLHPVLRALEGNLRSGPRFVDLDALLANNAEGFSPAQNALLAASLNVLIRGPGAARTTADMALWLQDLCALLLEHGADMWQRFPLDAEAMYRLVRHAAPVLRQNCLAQTPFPVLTLHGIVRQVLQQERVPFEAEPLTGLQVLGMLETRLLHFERVFIMDATDDKLPGNPAQDPLLPDSLRHMLGLPDAHRRERAAAHTLYRLCAGAKEVRFFWQEGISRSTLFDGKKSRSRFVEQLLWEEEQRRGALLTPGQEPLMTASCCVRSAHMPLRIVPRGPELAEALLRLLDSPISATRLDIYQQCPLRFVRQYLCGLRQPQEVNEGDDPAAVGICIHDTLRALYEPWLNKVVQRGDISPETLRTCFFTSLRQTNLQKLLPPDSCLMLEEAAPVRLQRFLDNQPESVTVMALETSLDARLRLAGRDYAFKGIVDRLDQRDGLLHILDYKTGCITKHDGSLWTDTLFFRRVAALCAQLQPGMRTSPEVLEELDALFDELRLRLPSLQLPCYLSLARARGLGPLGDAALVELRDAGKELPLFGGLMDEDLEAALDYCDLSLALVLLHMEHSPHFAARPDSHCRWCPHAALCAV